MLHELSAYIALLTMAGAIAFVVASLFADRAKIVAALLGKTAMVSAPPRPGRAVRITPRTQAAAPTNWRVAA